MQNNRGKQIVSCLLAGLLVATAFSGCSSKDEESSPSSAVSTTAVTEAPTEAKTEAETTAVETTEAVETTTTHISPMETVSSTLGAEVTDLNILLDRDGENTYKHDLADFIQDGDVIQSFTFIFYAPDGTSDMVNYKGGCGISVKEDSPTATDKGWYQSDDFEQRVNGAYAEITWNVPTDVAADVDADGKILIGYWWSELQQVKLSSIVCTYTRTAEIPVDGTAETSPAATLNDSSDTDKQVKLPLSDWIGEGDTLQTVTFDISSSGALGKFTGAFGVSLKSGCPAETDKNWYQTGNIVIFTQDSSVSLTWIVPDAVKAYLDTDGEIMLGYWWSDQAQVTLDKVSVRYSNGTGVSTKTEATPVDQSEAGEVKQAGNAAVSSEQVNQMTSSEIVADMKIGWNLGNTLDSFDTDSSDNETGWGNPKTTKAMIDTVKAAGFNAVRIPVTWGEHLSSDHVIEAAYLDRVQEVVDYAMDDDLYVILNVHHDDAIWLHPTYSEQAEVTETLTAIWQQLSERFADYDHHLVFEGMNEPRVIGSSTEWSGGTPEERDVINQLFQAFVDTVRATGGLNADRTLIVTSHAQSITKEAVSAVKVPEDDHIAVSIHSYAPWDFCGTDDDRSDWGSEADKQELDSNFQYLADTFIKKGIPVLLDEFGAVNKNNTSIRANYYAYYVKSAKAHGITCFVWDNGTEKEFGLLNRKNLTWYAPSIIEAMMQAL
ncbi:MAG: cellulase family glycosylhydrolase [Oscillospiraceae bacterium]|nr:cellulase family glycosylhydrolase [Oscillospiraceae bacterium]